MGTKIKWTPEMDTLLGTIPDLDLATKLGVSHVTVWKRRKKLEIPSFGYRRGTIWTPEMDTLLGTERDKDIAKKLGFTKPTVRYRRHELSIPSWKSQNRVIPENVSHCSSEAQRIYDARRRHLVKGLSNTLTCEQWKYACNYFNNCCAYCGRDCNILTEDHLKPVNKGGLRTALNIIPACWPCNSSKHTKRADIWIYEKFGMEEGKDIIDDIVAYLTEVQECLRT